jgi:hypothetical protein
MSGNDMNRRRVELPPNEQLTFAAVRRVVERIGAKIVAERLQTCDDTYSEKELASRHQTVIEAGLDEFDRRRRLSSDEQVPRWHEPVRGVMRACAADVFAEPRDDDGSLPVDGAAPRRKPGDGRTTAPIPRGKYMATRNQLGEYVRGAAERRVKSYVRSWSYDSQMIDDMIQNVATASSERALATWDADQAPLLRYVDVLVKYAVLGEHRRRVRAQVKDGDVIAACAADLTGGCALRGSSEEDHDPLARLLADEDADQRAALMSALPDAIDTLSPKLRAEIHRRLKSDSPGTPKQQTRYSRAVAKLRELLADIAPTV